MAREGATGTAAARLAGAVATGRTVYAVAVETHISLLAAAIAYFGFVSMVPLVVLGVALATGIGGPVLAERVVGLAGEVLTPAGEELLLSAITSRSGAGGVTAIGLLVLPWGALKSFRALDRAFSLVYGQRPADSILTQLASATVAAVAVGAGTLLMIAVAAAVTLLSGTPLGFVGPIALVPTLVVVFLPLYYLFPDVPLSVVQVLPGAALAAVGWTALGTGFGVYTATVADPSIYGLLGGVLLVLTWFYLGALLLLVGATVNAVRSGHAVRTDR